MDKMDMGYGMLMDTWPTQKKELQYGESKIMRMFKIVRYSLTSIVKLSWNYQGPTMKIIVGFGTKESRKVDQESVL